MGRIKGTPKTGGRKAGTPNKTTTDIKTWVANILDSGQDEFAKRLARLDDRDYIRTYNVTRYTRGYIEKRARYDARVTFINARAND